MIYMVHVLKELTENSQTALKDTYENKEIASSVGKLTCRAGLKTFDHWNP